MRQLAKNFLRTAGTSLGSYLDDAFRLGGDVGQNLATTALRKGKEKFAPESTKTEKTEITNTMLFFFEKKYFSAMKLVDFKPSFLLDFRLHF